ncbi:flagellar biosynthesis protein FlhB [Campylobacterota bacterium]|nr:flagellar biosynthesis protein FlhB [Campylobacterota bacterium]
MAEESSSEKTEEASAKKLEDEQKGGNVPQSIDTAGFVSLAIAVLAFVMLFGFISTILMNFFRYCTAHYGVQLGQNTIAEIALTTIAQMSKSVVPLALMVTMAGVLGYVMQFGFIFTTKPLEPKLSKISPIKGLGRLFSMKKLLDGFKTTFKVLIALSVASWFLWKYIKELATLHLFNMGDQIDWLLDKMLVVALVMLIVFFFFAVVDFAIARYFYFKNLRMSKQEQKDEWKNIDGNPEIKARIRRIQMEMSRKRMLQDVPKADVVVTNPTHFAVALKYTHKIGTNSAPIVLAKGADLIAVKIKEIAREHDIPIVENPPLARELYKKVDLGEMIPNELFAAVAELFSYVARTTGKRFI